MSGTTTFFPVTAVLLVIGGCSAQPQHAFIDTMGSQTRSAAKTIDQGASPEARPEVTTRRVWRGLDAAFYTTSISPDGRYISMPLTGWVRGSQPAQWGNLAVRDLTTGRLHPLTNVHNEEGKLVERVGPSVFSRDGSRIIVAWSIGDRDQLRVIDFAPDSAGFPQVGDGRVVFENAQLDPHFPLDWSPDGSEVLARVYLRERSAGGNQLALISATDGSYRALTSLGWRVPLRAKFSPDGRFVAYDLPIDVDSADRDLFVTSLDGAYEARIVPDPAFDRLLGWLPDGSILFASERSGTLGVWRVRMAEGRPSGDAELVKGGLPDVEPIGFGGNRLYYGVDADPKRLFTASVELSTGRLTSPAEAIGGPSNPAIRGWEWSPDGSLLAYSATGPGYEGSMISIRSAAGEVLQTVHLDLRPPARMRWTPDNRSLVVATYDTKDRFGFHRIDLERGSSSAILTPGDGRFDLSSDGGTLYFARPGPRALVAYDIASGTERVILPRGEVSGNVALSPDGVRLAFVTAPTSGRPGVVSTVPVTGGPVTPIAHLLSSLQYISGLEWTPDGRSILVVASERGDATRQLWIVSAAGGAARRISLTEPSGGRPFLWRQLGISPVRLHPDGRQIGFLAGTGRGDVWVMEGLAGSQRSTSRVQGSQ